MLGYFFDDEYDTYYVRARHYSPLLGRWLSQDPLGVAAGANLYVYVGDSPLCHVDPLGLKTQTICCTQWTRRFVTLGYANHQVGALECTLDELGSNPVYRAVIAAAIASGTATVAGILKILKVQYGGSLGILGAIALATKFLNDYTDAAKYCHAFVCTQTVPKVPIIYLRRWYNPCRWLGWTTYTVMECPAGSEEAELNEGMQATKPSKVGDPTIPKPPPGTVLIWPRRPTPP